MTTTAFPRRMGASDAVMWGLERDPRLRSTITAIAVLDRAPDWDRVVASVDRASRAIPRMRQRAVPAVIGPPRWVVTGDVDLAYHLRHVEVPAPHDLDAVLDLAATSAMGGFDRTRPLWEFTLVEGLADGRAALVEKIHHAVTDGVGGIALAAHLFDTERDAPARPVPDAPAADPVGAGAAVREAVADAGRAASDAVRALPAAALGAARAVAGAPVASAARAARTIGSVGMTMAPVTRTLSPVLRERSANLRYDVFDVALDDLKRSARVADVHLNDAFVAAVAGGLARYHVEHRAPVPELRMTMPISVRSADDPLGGNRFVPARFVVPVGVGDPVERMRRIAAQSRAWRDEPALAHTEQLAGALRRLPGPLLTGIFGAMLKHVDFVTTDVPGFPFPVYLGGAEVVRHYVLAPPTGAALNVGLLSHVGTCCIGIASDAAAVTDQHLLGASIRAGFDEVLAVR